MLTACSDLSTPPGDTTMEPTSLLAVLSDIDTHYQQTLTLEALAQRAVGNACGRNRVAVLIPCHRALRKDGGLGGFRWGEELKRHLLRLEQSGQV